MGNENGNTFKLNFMRRASAQVTLFAPLEASPPLSGPASVELCSSHGTARFAKDSGAAKYHSMDWFKGKITGKPHLYWENPWFPADFPLNQSIESCFILILSVFFPYVLYFFHIIKVVQFVSQFWSIRLKSPHKPSGRMAPTSPTDFSRRCWAFSCASTAGNYW